MAQAASLDDWDTMVDTNVKGLVYVTRACLPGMVSRNRGVCFLHSSLLLSSHPDPHSRAHYQHWEHRC